MRFVFSSVGLVFSAVIAQAVTTIDFNSIAPNTIVSGAGAINTDVTFSSSDGGPIRVIDYIGRRWVAEDTPGSAYRADFNVPVNFVGVFIGDNGSDEDSIYLNAYDASNNLLGSVADLLPSNLVGGKTLSFSAPSISYVVFGAVGVPGFANSVLFDDFQYTVVPEPSSLTLLTATLTGYLLFRRPRIGKVS